MDADVVELPPRICQVCGSGDACLRSDPNGTEPDLLCPSCHGLGVRNVEWWS